jgi:hypothetical protein
VTLYGLGDVDPDAPPRRNGELAFDEPWQSRVFGMATAVVELHLGGEREPFRQHLIAAIAEDPARAYWDSWSIALERLLVDLDLLSAADLAQL